MQVFLSLILILTLASCDYESGGSDDIQIVVPSPSSDGIWLRQEGWSESISYQEINLGDETEVTHIKSYENSLYILVSVKEGNSYQRKVLFKLGKEGFREWKYEPKKDHVLINFLVSSHGLLVLETIPQDNELYSVINMILFNHDGNKIQQKLLDDAPSEKELLYYTFDHDANKINRHSNSHLSDGQHPVFFDPYVKLEESKDGFMILAYTYGIKLYHYNWNFEQVWDVQTAPASSFYSTYNIATMESVFSPLSSGGAVIVTAAGLIDTLAFDWHFNQRIDHQTSLSQSDLMITVINSSGKIESVVMKGSKEISENPVSLKIIDSDYLIGFDSLIKKFNRPNDTMESDIGLMTISSRSRESQIMLIDLDKEDWLYDMEIAHNGNINLMGYTGFTQVDTHSIVSYGSGFVLELDWQGTILEKAILSGPRDVKAMDACYLNEEMYVVGKMNGPISHTCDLSNDPLCNQKKGFLAKVVWQ